MSNCPYCASDLKREPKRRMACPACGSQVYVRAGRPRTKDEAHALDCCGNLLIPESTLLQTRQALSRQVGREVTIEETVRGLVTSRVADAASWHERKMLYFALARYLWENGRDCRIAREDAVRAEIKDCKESIAGYGFRKVRLRVIGSFDSCPSCRRVADRAFSLVDAETKMPLPIHSCTYGTTIDQPIGWCRCMYSVEVE
jgi:hypothetical protein